MLAVMINKFLLVRTQSLLVKDYIRCLSSVIESPYPFLISFLFQGPKFKFQNISPRFYFRRRMDYWKKIN